MNDPLVVIVVFAPVEDADKIREALAKAGAGQIGEYSSCSFSAPGEGRFLPGDSAHPVIGEAGRLEVVFEVRIECVCPRSQAHEAVKAMLDAHPYEEPAYHCYHALTLDDL